MKEKSAGKWLTTVVISTVFVLIVLAIPTVWIDPFLHYHNTLSKFQYPIDNQRYQNDGLVRQWKYDALITGSSMTEGFSVTKCNEIFGVDSLKVPFSGGTLYEISQNIRRAFSSDNKIKMVIRSLDYHHLVEDKKTLRTDYENPLFLTNNNLLDDVNYFFNKTILLDNTYAVVRYTKNGEVTTPREEYCGSGISDKDHYDIPIVAERNALDGNMPAEKHLSEEEKRILLENITYNLTGLADEHPETTFYYFFPPYSICFWDGLYHAGELHWKLEVDEIVIQELLKHKNIKVFGFCSDFALVTDLYKYHDEMHYGVWTNTDMLEWMKADTYLLTEDNYKEYMSEISTFYSGFDYESLHKDTE